MPNTGERREITRRVNAKEAETVQESKQLVSRTRSSPRVRIPGPKPEALKQKNSDLLKVERKYDCRPRLC
jgi:hypothetical protein